MKAERRKFYGYLVDERLHYENLKYQAELIDSGEAWKILAYQKETTLVNGTPTYVLNADPVKQAFGKAEMSADARRGKELIEELQERLEQVRQQAIEEYGLYQ